MTKPTHRHQHVAQLLLAFEQKHVNALLRHFSESVNAFESSKWEACISNGSKFVEAVIKVLAIHTGMTLPSAREFKFNKFVIQLGQLQAGTFDDSIRLLIPRNCTFVYDIASNRGTRHDPGDIDPNKMDAIAVIQNISWVLAEMIRLSHKGALNPDDAADVVDGLMEKRYPDIEDIDGRLYVNLDGVSAQDIALLVLERKYPVRFSRDKLLETLLRHDGVRKNNAQVAMTRIRKYIDDDGKGNLKLRANGRQKAADIRSSRKA
ncbi:MAG TPA: hypothetical protein VI913_04210 [Candidatus Peribacteraceae bacterium]|uniref:Uncharacterized protein n=1 Tax=Candidatus Muproteobacteria bacterium RIFCSPHIGHO2_02_FULL_65_16 TaxID=1817766 RepID=A0A1F6U0H7_9PROT|nr:MAG: hypothetical protein A3B81_05675 [Candidatus Muproteobacteria bacterium RIFCSPHIGHO2_02_FULL_65_16]HLD64069.1 hypothetical protein [Candidatus Peribacteraceae bacterium]